MSTRFEAIRESQNLLTAAMDVLAAERHYPQGSAVRKVEDGTACLVHAARQFVAVVDSLEPGEMPVSWRPRERQEQAS